MFLTVTIVITGLLSVKIMAREFAKKFYHSKAWELARNSIYQRDMGLCQKCLTEKNETVPGEEVHHKIFLRPSNINDPNITLNPDNLILLCKDCHIGIHKATTHKKRKRIVMNGTYINEEGQLQKQKIIIVHGAPASGKTSYVKEHMNKGDMVVDFDLIKESISMCFNRDVPETLLDTAFEIRELLYRLIEERKVDARTIWVIGTLPTRKQRSELISRLHADEVIHIEATIDECIERMLKDESRTDKEKQMQIIDGYFGYYQPPSQNKGR